jgi:hypothetical protein
MRCIVCHNIQQKAVGKNCTLQQKILVVYNKDHDTTTTNCHVVFQHFVLNQYKTQCVITYCYHNKKIQQTSQKKKPITTFNINF